MWITRLSQTVLNLSQPTAQTTLAATDEEDGNATDEEDDQGDGQPELFSIMDLDEDNDIRTELNNHPSVKRLTKTLNQQALFRGVPITKPTVTTTLRSDVDVEPDVIQGFIFPKEGKTAFPDINMGALRIALANSLKRPIDFWQDLERNCKVRESLVCITALRS